MTSDFIQQSQSRGKSRHAPLLIGKVEKKDKRELGPAPALEKDGLQRSISATIALLKRAHGIIERAEETIADQGERIRTLETLTVTDELTGLYNRRGFSAALMREIARTRRGLNEGGLLVLVEMDNLLSVQETYGTEAVSACLKMIARILEGETRLMDLCGHINRGEFMLLFTNAVSDVSLERTQKLATRLNNVSLIRRGREIQIATSISLTTYGPLDTPEDLLPARIQKETCE